MKTSEVNKKFNPYIKDIMDEGFYICATELTGSYSDILGNHTCFAKGNERVVVWLEMEREFRKNPVIHGYAARFTLAKGESTEWQYHWASEWKKHLVFDFTLYGVGERYNCDWFVDTEEEAQAARDKRIERYRQSATDSCAEVEMNDSLFEIARRHEGFKRAKREEVKVWRNKHSLGWAFRNMKSGREFTICA